jgi:hypothetical protein
VSSPAVQPARPVNATKTAVPRKHTDTATTAAENKRDERSLIARVRAALATVDANRKEPLAVPSQSYVRPPTSGPPSPAQSSTESSRSAVPQAVPPSTVEPGSIPAQQGQPNPLVSIEIQSRPVAPVQSSPTPPAEKETHS